MNLKNLSILMAIVAIGCGLCSCENETDSPLLPTKPQVANMNNNFIYDSPPDLNFYKQEFLEIEAKGAEFELVAKNYKSYDIKPVAGYSLISREVRIDDIRDYVTAFYTNNYWKVGDHLRFQANTLKVENDSTFSTPYLTIVQSPDDNHKFRIKVSPNSSASNRIFLLAFKPQVDRGLAGFVSISQAGE